MFSKYKMLSFNQMSDPALYRLLIKLLLLLSNRGSIRDMVVVTGDHNKVTKSAEEKEHMVAKYVMVSNRLKLFC